MGKCIKCGRNTDYRYTYYSARKLTQTREVTGDLFSKKETRQTTYTDMTSHNDYLCNGKGCWRDSKRDQDNLIEKIVTGLFALLLAFLGCFYVITMVTSNMEKSIGIGAAQFFMLLVVLLIFLIPAILIIRTVFHPAPTSYEQPNEEVGAAIICNIKGRRGMDGNVLLTPGEVKRITWYRTISEHHAAI